MASNSPFSSPYVCLLKSITRYGFNYSKGNYEELNDYLLNTNFSFEEDNISVEDMWLQIKTRILNACILYIPKVELIYLQSGLLPKFLN